MTNGLPTRLPTSPRIRRYGDTTGVTPQPQMYGSPLSYAQMLSAADAASRKAFPQQTASTSGVPMPTVLPKPRPVMTPPPSQPSGFMGAFSQPLTSPVGQAISQAAIAGARASDWSPTPVSLGRVLAEMGAAASQGYAGAQQQRLANLLTQAQIAEKVGKAGQAFSGTSMTSQSFNALLDIGPKIQAGKATEPEIAQYNLAYGYLSKPQTRSTFDAEGNETRTVVPAQDLSQFPMPKGFSQIGAETVKPGAQALKDVSKVRSGQMMLANLNSYRQTLMNPDFTVASQAGGALGFPRGLAGIAENQAEALRMDLKELYGLGALVGGDFAILDRMLKNPNTVEAIQGGRELLINQLDQLERRLEIDMAQKDYELKGTYALPIEAKDEAAYRAAPNYTYVRLPNGQVVFKDPRAKRQ